MSHPLLIALGTIVVFTLARWALKFYWFCCWVRDLHRVDP